MIVWADISFGIPDILNRGTLMAEKNMDDILQENVVPLSRFFVSTFLFLYNNARLLSAVVVLLYPPEFHRTCLRYIGEVFSKGGHILR